MSVDFVIPDKLRRLGIHIVSGKGTGKSRFMGRLLSFQDVRRGIPTVIIDPKGQTITNLLDRILRLPEVDQLELWPRIRYVEMIGRNGYIMPFPIYYRQGNESYMKIAKRVIELIRRDNPQLEDAPVNGMNAIRTVAWHAGIVLFALGLQITEADHLLAHPDQWKERLHNLQAADTSSEIQQACDFFLNRYTRSQGTAFQNKLPLFTLDPASRVIFGASKPGIDLREVVQDGLAVLIDLSGESDKQIRTFNMRWLFQYLMTYIEMVRDGRPKPLSLIIDELNGIYRTGDEEFHNEMDDLIHETARNYNIWLTLAHQEMHQFDEDTQRVLMTAGTQIIGRTDDPKTARYYAHHFHDFDEDWVRYTTPIIGHQSSDGMSYPIVLGEKPTHFSPDEQERLEMPKFRRRSPLRFLAKLAESDDLRPIRLVGEDITRDINRVQVERAKDILMRRFGVAITDVEQEIRARLSSKALPVAPASLEYEVPTGYEIQRQGGDDEDPVFKASRTGTGEKQQAPVRENAAG